MNRKEFMTELERLLSCLPDDERQEAVQYYADYFADAGEENEASVIRELGSPEKVAETIKADYYGKTFDEDAYTEKHYMQKKGEDDHREGAEKENNNKPWTNRWVKIALIILIIIAAWPVAAGIVCTVLGILATVVCFFAALVLASVCIMIAGGIIAVSGIALIVVPPAAFILIGIGILLFVLGMAATAGTVKLCIIVYPAMIRGFVNLCRRPFYGKAVS